MNTSPQNTKRECVLSKMSSYNVLSHKCPVFYQESPVFCQKSDRTHSVFYQKRALHWHGASQALHAIPARICSVKRAGYSIKRAVSSVKRALYSIKKRASYWRGASQALHARFQRESVLSKEPCIRSKEPYLLSYMYMHIYIYIYM